MDIRDIASQSATHIFYDDLQYKEFYAHCKVLDSSLVSLLDTTPRSVDDSHLTYLFSDGEKHRSLHTYFKFISWSEGTAVLFSQFETDRESATIGSLQA